MVNIDKWTKVRLMYEEGHSKRSIALSLKMSRNTVKKIIDQVQFQKYQRKEKEEKLIALYENQIIDFHIEHDWYKDL